MSARPSLLHLRIGLIVAAHETQLNVFLTRGYLGLYHLDTLRRGLRQRLFAQHSLAGPDTANRQTGMGEIGAGHDDRIHIMASNDALRVTGNVCSAISIGNGPGPRLILVADHLEDCTGKVFGHDFRVIRTHETRANDSYSC